MIDQAINQENMRYAHTKETHSAYSPTVERITPCISSASTSLKAASLLILERNTQRINSASSTQKDAHIVLHKTGEKYAQYAPDSQPMQSGLCAELEHLIDLVGRHYNTPSDEYPIIRQTAAKDTAAALRSYRLMALEIEQEASQGDNAASTEQSPLPELVSCHGCLYHDFDTTPGKFNPICKIHAALPFVRWSAGINVLARSCSKKKDRPQTDKTEHTKSTT